ncbi:MAG: flagellar protein FliS [Clostridiales bacterium]|jgi:flagellar protein FliS|nr:flagellar protein FliS [Clostridiales bacterium]
MPYDKAQYAARIRAASAFELVIINYELFLITVEDAIESPEAVPLVRRARAFLHELIVSLDMESQLAENLYPLYIYVNKLLSECTVKKNNVKLEEVRKIMSSLLDAWKEAGKKQGKELNEFYENVSYSRKGLSENTVDSGADYKI